MKFTPILILICLISACQQKSYNDDLLITSDDPNGREIPSCRYDNDAKISNYDLTISSWYSPDYDDFGSFQRCTFEPVGYRETLVAQYYGNSDFDDIYDQLAFDLSQSEDVMELFFRKDSEFSYQAIEGKLYMDRTSEEWMKITWCDAKFLDSSGETLVSSGSFSVRF